MTRADRCACCDARRTWTVRRRGDAAVRWTCSKHLALVCDSLQRDSEVTELTVTLSEKYLEWAEINESLRQIAEAAQ